MYKKRIVFLLIIVLLFSEINMASDELGKVYIVKIKDVINDASYRFIRNEVNKILAKNDAVAIIFEIDTYGGLIDSAIKIKDLIIDLDIKTISYVNNKAESAGVLLAISSDNLIMHKTATIGSAETIPNNEKTLSLWRSVLRNTAEYRNINPKIIEAMADKDIVVDGINSKGKLINLTAKEALTNNISELSVNNYSDICREFNFEETMLDRIDENLSVKVAKYISKPNISSFLLFLIFLGIIIEFFTLGFGVGATISVASFGIYIGGNIMAGYGSTTSLVFFITGIILLIIEAIVPGFGVPGISGIILVVAGIILSTESIVISVVSVGIAILLIIIISLFVINRGMRSKRMNKIVLDTKLNDEGNYLSTDNMHEYLNKEGVALTSLRPSGFIKIGDKKLDALSDEGFIKMDSEIKVVRVEGSKIFVRRV